MEGYGSLIESDVGSNEREGKFGEVLKAPDYPKAKAMGLQNTPKE
jgi:hypothetical protein